MESVIKLFIFQETLQVCVCLFVCVWNTHLQLDVQLSCRTGQLTQIGQDVFTEVRYKTSGMDIFLPEEKQDQSVGGETHSEALLPVRTATLEGEPVGGSQGHSQISPQHLNHSWGTHRKEGQRLACALQQAIHSVGVGGVECLFQEGLLHHQLHQLLPATDRLQHPQAWHHPHQQHKLLPRHILQHLKTVATFSQLFPLLFYTKHFPHSSSATEHHLNPKFKILNLIFEKQMDDKCNYPISLSKKAAV